MSAILNKYFDVIKKLIPEKVVHPTIGLDIGSNFVKAVQLRRQGANYEILNWTIEPIQQRDTLAATKKVVSKLYLDSKSIATSIAGKGTLIRYIDMPKMPIADLRNSIDIEADKHFPFPKEQIYTDCYVLNSIDSSSIMQVMVAAAKKEIIESRMKFLASLDVKANFIGINSIAISNVFNVLGRIESGKDEGDTDVKQDVKAVLDIGHTISSLVILKNNIPFFTRDIFMGGFDFEKRISNSLAVDMDQARELKCNPAERLSEIQGACESVLMNLVSELRLSFDYFVTEKNLSINKLYVTGGTSMFTGIAEFLSKNLEMVAEIWDPFFSERIKTNHNEKELNSCKSQMGVALGLALYQND